MIYRHKMPYSGGCCGITLHKTVLIAGLSKQNCCRHTLSPKILRPEISNPAPLPLWKLEPVDRRLYVASGYNKITRNLGNPTLYVWIEKSTGNPNLWIWIEKNTGNPNLWIRIEQSTGNPNL